MTKFTMCKKWHKIYNLMIISKPHAHPHTIKKTYMQSFKTIGTKLYEELGSQTPRLNVDG